MPLLDTGPGRAPDNRPMDQAVATPTEQLDLGLALPWQNSFASLGPAFYTELMPSPLPSPYVVGVNDALARELGVRRGAAVTVQTANGPATGFETRLDSVRLGPIEMRDVAALVAGEMTGDNTVLLGMSFLKRVEFTQSGDRLVLRSLAAH